MYGCTEADLGVEMTDAEIGLAILRNRAEWEPQWWTQQKDIASREWASFDTGRVPLDEAMRFLTLFREDYPGIPFRLFHAPTQKGRRWLHPRALVDTPDEGEYVQP